jgi:hypothetical protein
VSLRAFWEFTSATASLGLSLPCGRVQGRVKLSRQFVAVRSMRTLAPAGKLESGS